MRLKWFLIISSYWITTCLGQFRGSNLSAVPNFGGNRLIGTGISHISQPAHSSAVLNRLVGSPYYSVYNPNVPRYTTWQVTTGLNTRNTLHTPRVVAASPLVTIGGLSSIHGVQTVNTMNPTYGKTNLHTIPAQTIRPTSASIPREQILQTATRPSRMLLPPSPKNIYATPNNRLGSLPSRTTLRQASYNSSAVKPVEMTQPLPIDNLPWETLKRANSQQQSQKAADNNISPWQNSIQNYDVINDDVARKPRSEMVGGDQSKKSLKRVAAKQINVAKTASHSLHSDLSDQSWDANRNEHVWKSSVNAKLPSHPSKLMKNQIVLITIIISIFLICAGVMVFLCSGY